MINKSFNLFLLASCMLATSPTHSIAQKADSIANRMFERTQRIKTLSYVMTKKEMIGDELQEQSSLVRLSREPFKVYTKQLSPGDGIEVLYVEGQKTALINPNGFPWFNVRLDPRGSRMTKGQHHTIYHSGFDLFVSILQHLLKKYNAQLGNMVTVKDHVTPDGRDTWMLEFDNPHFKWIDYTVKANETLLSIADDHFVSAYMILQYNSDIDDFSDVDRNQVIKIPNDYSPKMSLVIDKMDLIPLEISVYDEAGLFEHYKFSSITIDPQFEPLEFTPHHSDYGF